MPTRGWLVQECENFKSSRAHLDAQTLQRPLALSVQWPWSKLKVCRVTGELKPAAGGGASGSSLILAPRLLFLCVSELSDQLVLSCRQRKHGESWTFQELEKWNKAISSSFTDLQSIADLHQETGTWDKVFQSCFTELNLVLKEF